VTGGREGRPFLGVLAAALAVALLEASRALWGAPATAAGTLERALFVAAAIVAAGLCRPGRLPDGRWMIPPAGALFAAAAVFAALLAAGSTGVAMAWIAITALFAVTLGAGAGPERAVGRALLLALAAGGAAMGAVEAESRFADEEIFAALEALLFAATWLALLASVRMLFPQAPTPRRGLRVSPRVLASAALLLAAGGLAAAVAAYHRSFSPLDVPSYPGISTQAPFLCGKGVPDAERFDGRSVFADLLARVAANPRLTPPEEGMLALGTREARRAAAFRSGLLEEAAAGRFTRTSEMKYWQYEASQRAYYYAEVRRNFPGLFTPGDERALATWFAAINRKALAVRLDDLIYAVAFDKFPEGPYENQENGAGLLSLLEKEHLASPELSPRNRRYLDRAPRGWEVRFRNNDDSYGYQREWIHNAYFESLRTGRFPTDAMRRSFEWLLLQVPPGGFPPSYDTAAPPSLPGTAYLGARLLQDPQLLWLSGKSVRALAQRGLALQAQPGVEGPVSGEGVSPSTGSCLLFADTGLPTAVGPLAPDKIVFRDGWADGSGYLLLNLRFTGWHRYRATNAIVTLQSGDARAEERRGQPFPWLPRERRIFRDKRIPRENLNGLLVEQAGFSAAVSRLTGFGGRWAQDPPRLARVEEFHTGPEVDRSTTAVSDWRGWSHRRIVAFFHGGGPIVVVDQASGPASRQAAVAWHVDATREPEGMRFSLGAGSRAELVLLSTDGSSGAVETRRLPEAGKLDVLYEPVRPGRLDLASVFLPERWRGAKVEIRSEGAAKALVVWRGEERLSVPLP